MGEFADIEIDRIIDQVTYYDQDSACFIEEPRLRDPLYYHVLVDYEKIIAETEKAVLLRITCIHPKTNDTQEYLPKDFWIPKSLCKGWDTENKTVNVWKRFFWLNKRK